ncbi:uncharacterized protein LOC144860469 isoform X2 [Branchiostoma floridae x Branchiostoma japonicum]
MGNGESKPKETKDADVIDPAAKAASMLAKQMVRGPVRFQQLPEATGDTAEETATVQNKTDETKEVSAILKSGISVVRTVMGTYGGREGVVAGALTQAIFGDIIDEMFPPKSSTPNTDDMKQLVKQDLTQDTLDKVNGLLHELRDALAMNYATDRRNSDLKDAANRQRLFDYLQDLDTNLTTEGVIGTLMQEEYAKVGLSSFLFLAGLRLAIYQEMAVVDPQNEDPDLDPAESRRYAEPETGIVATHAKEYAQHVEKWWPKIVEDRRSAVVCQRSPAHAFGIYPEQCWVNDEFTGQDDIFTSSASIIYGKSSVDVQAEYIEYKEEMVRKLEERFCHPEEIAANWRKLIVTPINTAVDTPSNTAVDTPSNTAVDTPSNTAVDTPSNTAADMPSNTAVDTPSNTAADTPSNTAVDTPSNTAVYMPSNTAVGTSINTAVDTPSNTAVDTPSNTAVDVGSG